MALPGITFCSPMSQARALDLETEPVDLVAKPCTALGVLTCLMLMGCCGSTRAAPHSILIRVGFILIDKLSHILRLR